ncbi:MAG TPA: ribosome silencing factor [Cytophagaceae bacterium]|nr:ribosome silencing factor [Cytophagaceae bacterium]
MSKVKKATEVKKKAAAKPALKKSTIKKPIIKKKADKKVLKEKFEKEPAKKKAEKAPVKKISAKQKNELVDLIVKGMQEVKAIDITVMDLREIKNSIADYFVICSGNSNTQIDAIAESVDKEVYKAIKQNPWHKEGKENKEWILIDYVDVVAHVFNKDRREFFSLEELWGDATITHID